MRCLLGFLCVCALGVVLLVGCGETSSVCEGMVCPCTERGIRAAIAQGGGPFSFDCNGATTVVTEAEVVIDNDVILDGEGNLTVDGADEHRVFSIPQNVKVELRGLTVTHGFRGGGITNEGLLTVERCVISDNSTTAPPIGLEGGGGGVWNAGQMSIINTTIADNVASHTTGGGIYNDWSGTLTLTNSTIAGNAAYIDGWGGVGGGIRNEGQMTITNSTVSGNSVAGIEDVSGGGILNGGWMSLVNSTISGNRASFGDAIGIESTSASRRDSYVGIARTLIDGECSREADIESNVTWASSGYNVESPGDTCGFDQQGDQVDVTAKELNLGELADNGGSTMTHGVGLLPTLSVAIDRISAADCPDADGEPLMTDQRGLPRPETGGTMCDVGAFEVQP